MFIGAAAVFVLGLGGFWHATRGPITRGRGDHTVECTLFRANFAKYAEHSVPEVRAAEPVVQRSVRREV
jgi:hypothetical protein